jgi:hypothetical protein
MNINWVTNAILIGNDSRSSFKRAFHIICDEHQPSNDLNQLCLTQDNLSSKIIAREMNEILMLGPETSEQHALLRHQRCVAYRLNLITIIDYTGNACSDTAYTNCHSTMA